jgi:hypothetical protein
MLDYKSEFIGGIKILLIKKHTAREFLIESNYHFKSIFSLK